MIQFIKGLFTNKITLVPSDFDSLTETVYKTGQFNNTKDCPVFRAAKRQRIPMRRIDCRVGAQSIFFDCHRVEEIRERLLAGEPSVTVKIMGE